MAEEKREDGAYNLRAIFEQMELELVQNLRRNLKRHEKEEKKEGFNWEMWQRAKLRNLRKYRQKNKEIVGKYSREIDDLIRKTLQEEYTRAESLWSKLFGRIKRFFSRRGLTYPESINNYGSEESAPNEEDFFRVNKRKIRLLQETAGNQEIPTEEEEPFRPEGKEKELSGTTNDAKLENMKNQVVTDLRNARGAVWRRMDDVYRKTIYKAEMMMAAGAKTLEQAIDMATKDFLNAGINCIEYRNGRRVNIASYAEMALRTASQRATLLAEGKKRDEWGVHTVVVTAHANTCPLCAPWQGKVLVDDVYCHGTLEEAKDLSVPLLSTAMKAGLLHPNCRHTISIYFPGITKLPQVPDTKKAIETYKAEQEQRALERKIWKWKRIAEGSLEPEKEELAAAKVKEYQKEIRRHLKKYPELRRRYDRENLHSTKGIAKKNDSGIIKKNGDMLKMNLQLFSEKDIYKQSSASLKRGIKSYKEVISIHEDKIAHPEKYCLDWDEKDPREQTGLRRHWEKEVRNAQQSVEDRIEELKKRGDYVEE